MSRARRAMLVATVLLLSARAGAAALDGGLFDDFESGSVLATDVPPGRWGSPAISPGNTLLASAVAAHRGAFGLRVTDTNPNLPARVEACVRGDIGLNTNPDFYARAWVRFSAPSLGNVILFDMLTTQHQVLSVYSEPTLAVAGFDHAATFTSVGSTAHLDDGGFNLLEVAVSGLGTSAGSRRLWLNAQPLMTQGGIDFSTEFALQVEVGSCYSDDPNYVGTLDFDDYRAGRLPMASHLAFSLAADAGTVVGRCESVTIEVRDSVDGGPATLPYASSVAVAMTGVDGGLFTGVGCNGPAPLCAVFPDTTTQCTFRVRADAPGLMQLTATHPDLLPATASMAVLVPDAGPTDSGVLDAGSLDGGPPDAGELDAGTPDSGAADAGELDGAVPDGGSEADAGTSPAGTLQVGCGCQPAGGPGLLTLGLLAWAAARRRGAQRACRTMKLVNGRASH